MGSVAASRVSPITNILYIQRPLTESPMPLLANLRVVEIAHPLTEYAGLVLAGLGAEVCLIEPPQGSPTRAREPRVPGAGASSRGSIAFLARNANKRSVVIDPEAAADRELFARLSRRADVVLSIDGHPLAADIASETSVVTIEDRYNLGNSSIVPFAASGGLASSGWPERPPCNAPSYLAPDGASIYAAVMALLLEFTKRRGGSSARVSIPLEEAAVAAITPWTRPLRSYEMQATGQGMRTERRGPGGFPIYKVKDGYVRALTVTPKQWDALVDLLGSPEEFTTGPFKDPTFRQENADVVVMMCEPLLANRTVAELFREGQARGLTISPVYDLPSFRTDPHVVDRQCFTTVDDPEFGEMDLMRPPCQPAELNAPVRGAPSLGDFTADAATLSVPEPGAAGAPSIDPLLPLAGVRILELGVGAVVPEAASLLAQFGAEVIKVESRVRVDFLRQNGLAGYMDVNNSPTFNQLNLGTKSLAVDMNHAAGVALVRELADHCDIVMDNMRGGIAAGWGLDYAGISATNPSIIYLTSQGFGRGIYDGFQTYGPNLQTFAGVTAQWAHPDDPYPVGTTLNHPDHMAGKQALVPLLAALIDRERTGRGCEIEGAQFEAAAYLISDRLLEQTITGDAPLPPLGNTSRDFAPHGCYACTGEDRWIALAIENDIEWQRLVDLIGDDSLDDPLLENRAERLKASERIDAAISRWSSALQVEAAEQALRDAGLHASRVVTGPDIEHDTNAHASGFYAALPHPTSAARHYTALPVLFESAEGQRRRPAPRRAPLLGEHTEEVVYGILELTPARVSELVASGIIGT